MYLYHTVVQEGPSNWYVCHVQSVQYHTAGTTAVVQQLCTIDLTTTVQVVYNNNSRQRTRYLVQISLTVVLVRLEYFVELILMHSQ